METTDNEETHVPHFKYRDAVDRAERYQQKLAEAQARYDALAVRMAVDDALAPLNPATDDVANLRTILSGSARSDGVNVIVDYREGDNVLTISPSEAVARMQASESHACLFNRVKPKEPTPQEKHLAWLQTLTPKQYDAYREKRRKAGGDHLMPE